MAKVEETQLTEILEGQANQIHAYYAKVIAEKERAIAEATLAFERVTDMYNSAVDYIQKMEKPTEAEDLPVIAEGSN